MICLVVKVELDLDLVLDRDDGFCILPGLSLDLRWEIDDSSLLEMRFRDGCWCMSTLLTTRSVQLLDLISNVSRFGAEQRNNGIKPCHSIGICRWSSKYMYMHPLEEVSACFTSGGDDVVRASRFAGFEKEGNDAALSRTSSPLV